MAYFFSRLFQAYSNNKKIYEFFYLFSITFHTRANENPEWKDKIYLSSAENRMWIGILKKKKYTIFCKDENLSEYRRNLFRCWFSFIFTIFFLIIHLKCFKHLHNVRLILVHFFVFLLIKLKLIYSFEWFCLLGLLLEIFLCFNYHFVFFFVIIIIRLLIMMLSKNYANRLVAFILSYAITSKDFVKYNVFFFI